MTNAGSEPRPKDGGYGGTELRSDEGIDRLTLSEEFRLFHRLCHDRKLDYFIKTENDNLMDGPARILSGRVDIGAYEFGRGI